ncbi:MAG: hypothetical protein GX786_03235 [Clostridiales bacterium]|nr:hypothetical protein [Clostridiales bacterium]
MDELFGLMIVLFVAISVIGSQGKRKQQQSSQRKSGSPYLPSQQEKSLEKEEKFPRAETIYKNAEESVRKEAIFPVWQTTPNSTRAPLGTSAREKADKGGLSTGFEKPWESKLDWSEMEREGVRTFPQGLAKKEKSVYSAAQTEDTMESEKETFSFDISENALVQGIIMNEVLTRPCDRRRRMR